MTDRDWYRALRDRRDLDEVNFWQPGGNRADLHALFDRGYLTIVPDRGGTHCRVRVSVRLKTDYNNGEPYFPLNRQANFPPKDPADQPSRELLQWHADTKFRG